MSIEKWMLQLADYRGGIVEEVDVSAVCEDGRTGVITVFRFPGCRWLPPNWLESGGKSVPVPPQLGRVALRMAREAVAW